MPEIFQPENQISPQEEIPKLAEQIEELKNVQQRETVKFGYDDKSKRSKKKEVTTMELPDAKDIRQIEYKSDDKGKFHFEYKDENNYPRILTKGDILSDMAWGVYYDLNQKVEGQNQRVKFEKFRQQYVQQFYQLKIDRLQSMRMALQLSEEVRDTFKSETYRQIYQRLQESETDQSEQAGFLFEKMLEGLLVKVAEDLGHRD